MENLSKITAQLITAFIFSLLLSGCALIGLEDDSNDECKKDKRELIERSFRPTLTVTYSDYKPFSGKTTFSIRKVYCDGRINGEYVEKGESNINGTWSIGYIYTYKFEHPNDKVIVTIEVTGKDSDGLELTDTKTYTYYYADVEDQSLINMTDDYVVLLTWPSTQ